MSAARKMARNKMHTKPCALGLTSKQINRELPKMLARAERIIQQNKNKIFAYVDTIIISSLIRCFKWGKKRVIAFWKKIREFDFILAKPKFYGITMPELLENVVKGTGPNPDWSLKFKDYEPRQFNPTDALAKSPGKTLFEKCVNARANELATLSMNDTEIMTMVVLHDHFGIGVKRMKPYIDMVRKTFNGTFDNLPELVKLCGDKGIIPYNPDVVPMNDIIYPAVTVSKD